MHARSFVVIILLCYLVACSDNEPVKLTPAQAATRSAPSEPPSPTPTLPPGHPATSGKTLSFTPQEGWVAETPSSPMRKAQYKLPKQGSDPEDAVVIVSFFGGDA